MGRKKLVLEPIPRNTTKWKETLRKRKASLFKKATELSTLCDVETCVVLFEGPDDPTPVTWPPRQEDAMAVVSHFMSVPEAERAKKMLVLRPEISILPQQVQVQVQVQVPDQMQLQLQEMQLELQKIDRDNRQLEAAVFLNDVLSGKSTIADVASMESMVDLSEMVQKRLCEVNQRISQVASVSVSQPPDHLMTPQMGTTSASLFPGWCEEAVNDCGFWFSCPEQPPLMTAPDDWAPMAPSPSLSWGPTADVAPITDWAKEGGAEKEKEKDKDKDKDERCGPSNDQALVGAEMELDNDALEELLERCGPSNNDLALVGAEMEDDNDTLEELLERCKSDEATPLELWDINDSNF